MAGFLLEEFSQDGLASLLFSSRSLRKKDISTPNCSKRSAKSRFPSPARSQFKRNLTADSPFSIPSGRKKLRRVSRRYTIRILIAIAYWGQAMSIYRPLWNRPTASDLQNGRKLIRVAQTIEGNSQRERDYIDALAVFYADDNREYQERSADYCHVMKKLFAQYPKDREAAVFYALSLLRSQPDNDTELENPKKAIAKRTSFDISFTLRLICDRA